MIPHFNNSINCVEPNDPNKRQNVTVRGTGGYDGNYCGMNLTEKQEAKTLWCVSRSGYYR